MLVDVVWHTVVKARIWWHHNWPMNMLTEAIQAFRRDEEWVRQLIDVKQIQSNKRTKLALGLLAQAFHHAVSIRLLIGMSNPSERFGSALALKRPTFEGVVRGHWILDCATGQEVEIRYDNDDGAWPKSLETMCKEVDKVTGNTFFYEQHKSFYDAMCSYTHGGMRAAANGIEPTSTELEWWALVTFAHTLSLLAICAILATLSRTQEAVTVRKRAAEVWHAQPQPPYAPVGAQ